MSAATTNNDVDRARCLPATSCAVRVAVDIPPGGLDCGAQYELNTKCATLQFVTVTNCP